MYTIVFDGRNSAVMPGVEEALGRPATNFKAYLRKTVDDEHLPPFAFDSERQLTSVRRLAGEQRKGATLLFGHDPGQWATIENEGLHGGV